VPRWLPRLSPWKANDREIRRRSARGRQDPGRILADAVESGRRSAFSRCNRDRVLGAGSSPRLPRARYSSSHATPTASWAAYSCIRPGHRTSRIARTW
jgi:hypothetical protein